MAIVAAAALFAYAHSMSVPPTSGSKAISRVTIGTTTVAVEVADTEAAREQGLSDRPSLAAGHGMLFIFDAPQQAGFWMKDMRFDLDMLFADQSGRIVTIYSDVPASSYNASNPQASQVFYPSAPVTYVLEVPAGFAKAHGIAEGQTIVLK